MTDITLAMTNGEWPLRTTHIKNRPDMIFKLIKTTALTAMTALSTTVFAHDGHGLSGSHWHSTDAWGFVALALAIGAALWISRGDK